MKRTCLVLLVVLACILRASSEKAPVKSQDSAKKNQPPAKFSTPALKVNWPSILEKASKSTSSKQSAPLSLNKTPKISSKAGASKKKA